MSVSFEVVRVSPGDMLILRYDSKRMLPQEAQALLDSIKLPDGVLACCLPSGVDLESGHSAEMSSSAIEYCSLYLGHWMASRLEHVVSIPVGAACRLVVAMALRDEKENLLDPEKAAQRAMALQ